MKYRQEVGNNSRQGVLATHLSSYSSLKSLFHANYLLTAGESGINSLTQDVPTLLFRL
jgi:hypothetical protein